MQRKRGFKRRKIRRPTRRRRPPDIHASEVDTSSLFQSSDQPSFDSSCTDAETSSRLQIRHRLTKEKLMIYKREAKTAMMRALEQASELSLDRLKVAVKIATGFTGLLLSDILRVALQELQSSNTVEKTERGNYRICLLKRSEY